MTNPPGQGLDASIAEVLRGTTLGPQLDRPVNDILRDLGLPSLPQLPPAPPLPELPPLPVLDLAALTRPLTDIAASFGTGRLGQGLDPSQALEGISSALTTVMSLAQSVMSLAASDWSGAGAASAAAKGAAAQNDVVRVQVQNGQQKSVLTSAATTVATGATQMSAIIAKFVTALTVSAPFLVTPPGQVFLVSMAGETAAEAMVVVAATRAQLTVHSAEMTKAGEKVEITEAPKGVDGLSQVSEILGVLSPLLSVASTGAQSIDQLTSLLTENTSDPITGIADETPVDTVDSATAGLAVGGGGAAVGGLAAAAATPLSQWSGARTPPAGVGGGPATVTEPVTAPRTSGATGPAMVPPMGAAGMGHRAGDADTDEEVRTHLVTGEHGDAVVGELGNTGVPVVGAVGTTAAHTTQ